MGVARTLVEGKGEGVRTLVLESSVQSGLLSKFGKTGTETSLLRLKDLTKPD